MRNQPLRQQKLSIFLRKAVRHRRMVCCPARLLLACSRTPRDGVLFTRRGAYGLRLETRVDRSSLVNSMGIRQLVSRTHSLSPSAADVSDGVGRTGRWPRFGGRKKMTRCNSSVLLSGAGYTMPWIGHLDTGAFRVVRSKPVVPACRRAGR